VDGYDAAVERAQRYLAAGADGIFPEALKDAEELARFGRDVGGLLLANMTEFGKTQLLKADELGDMGYRLIIYPVTFQRLAMGALADGLAMLKRDGTQAGFVERMQTRQELYDLLGYDPSKSWPMGSD
jgi:methylisocitrate lyase